MLLLLLQALPTHSTNPLFQTTYFLPFFTLMLLAARVLGWCINCVYNLQHEECENKVSGSAYYWTCNVSCWSKRSGVYHWCMELGRIEVPFAYYLVQNKLLWDTRHILSSMKPSVSLLVLSPTYQQTRQNQNCYILHRNLLPHPT
jgi:hypothetical protein